MVSFFSILVIVFVKSNSLVKQRYGKILDNHVFQVDESIKEILVTFDYEVKGIDLHQSKYIYTVTLLRENVLVAEESYQLSNTTTGWLKLKIAFYQAETNKKVFSIDNPQPGMYMLETNGTKAPSNIKVSAKIELND